MIRQRFDNCNFGYVVEDLTPFFSEASRGYKEFAVGYKKVICGNKSGTIGGGLQVLAGYFLFVRRPISQNQNLMGISVALRLYLGLQNPYRYLLKMKKPQLKLS
jgi:hypothetical protein